MKGKILLTVTLMTIFGIVVKPNEPKKNILTNQSLIIAMDTCNLNYFLQKGNPCGYQLELFELFAQQKGVTLDFRIVPDSVKFDMLTKGDIDIMVFSKGFDSLYNVFNRYENICSTIPLDDTFKSVWLTVDKNMALMLEMNAWISNLKGERIYASLQAKYFNHRHKKTVDEISPYDNILKKYSAEIGWDWRLTAAVTYHESRFRPAIVSKSGATGLMQLMPNTVKRFGVKNVYNPEENIMGGMKLIAYLTKIFEEKGVSGEELTKFVLAAYNAGHGKIFKLMKEAEDAGLDKNKWNDIYSVVMAKSLNNDKLASASKSKFSGKETLKFVDNVLTNYKHYQNFMTID